MQLELDMERAMPSGENGSLLGRGGSSTHERVTPNI